MLTIRVGFTPTGGRAILAGQVIVLRRWIAALDPSTLPPSVRVCHNPPQTRMTEPGLTSCSTLSAPLGYSYARFYAWRFS